MIKTIKHISLIFILIIGSNIYGQNPYFGIKGGLNVSHMWLKDENRTLVKPLNFKPGYNGGLTMDYRIIPELTLNTSLLITTKGYQARKTEEFLNVEIKSSEHLTLYYIEFPVIAKYEFEFRNYDFFAGGGPFLSYGYWGKKYWKREGGGDSESGKEDIFFGDDPDIHDLKEYDYGINVCVGSKIDNIVAELGYNLSLPNISTKTENGQVTRNGSIYLSVSYFFSKFYKYNEANF